MSHHPFGGRHIVRCLTGLDFGLRIRVEAQSPQRTIFGGARNQHLRDLIAGLVEEISTLRVYSYSLRGQLEQTASAVVLNAEAGSWRYARRAALDLSGLLTLAAQRRLADRGLCARIANCALHVAEAIAREVR